MITNILKKLGSILGFVSICLVASCSDDEASKLADPEEMYGTDVVFRNNDLSLRINGIPFAEGTVSFEPVEDDSTLLLMSVYNYTPERFVDILVKVTPDEGFVSFEGTTQDMLKSYEAEVKGTYHPDADGNGYVEADCMISAAYWFAEVPFEYHFAKNTLRASTGESGVVEWNGKEIEKIDFVQSVLDKISQRIAAEVTDIKLMFHTDATFDIWLKRAGQSDYELWMTPRFWIENDYNQLMYWILTREQYEQFCTQWLGLLDFDGTSPFRSMLDGCYELPILCWASSDEFNWTIRNPRRYDALDMFLQGKGMEGLSEEEKEEMELFREVLYDVDDLSDGMSWCIIMSSEEQ